MNTAPVPAGAARRRFALYWTPPFAHPLWRAGCDWLGRDPARGDAVTTLAVLATAAPAHARDPWRYGFHATLKPPFALTAGADVAELLDCARDIARRHAAFVLPPLMVDELDGFIALRPAPQSPAAGLAALRSLADDCVRSADHLRAPPSADELARRRRDLLDARQLALLDAWGYPHVFDRWRFHLTLSDRLDAARRPALLARATRDFAAALSLPVECDAVTLFEERQPGAPLLAIAQVRLSSGEIERLPAMVA